MGRRSIKGEGSSAFRIRMVETYVDEHRLPHTSFEGPYATRAAAFGRRTSLLNEHAWRGRYSTVATRLDIEVEELCGKWKVVA